MFGLSGVEIFGYCGSVVVAISLMMKSIVKLRWLNLIGAIAFVIYGFMIKAAPVYVLNGFIAIADAYYLIQIYHQSDFFDILPVNDRHDAFLVRFLKFYDQDIHRYFPDFKLENIQNPFLFFIVRNMVPVGLFVGQPGVAGLLEIVLDYVTPDYRDSKNAIYVYKKRMDVFKSAGYRKLQILTVNPTHLAYIRKLGFQPDSDSNSYFFNIE